MRNIFNHRLSLLPTSCYIMQPVRYVLYCITACPKFRISNLIYLLLSEIGTLSKTSALFLERQKYCNNSKHLKYYQGQWQGTRLSRITCLCLRTYYAESEGFRNILWVIINFRCFLRLPMLYSNLKHV